MAKLKKKTTKKPQAKKPVARVVAKVVKKKPLAKKPSRKPIQKPKKIRYTSPLAKEPDEVKFRFKTVRHPRDGQGIEFRIPTSWKETWGSEDNSLYYPEVQGHSEPSPMGGKLYVRFRFEPVRNPVPSAAYSLLMSHRTDPTQQVTQTKSGMFQLRFTAHHHTDGYEAIDYYWFLATPRPPRYIAVASFLFSGMAALFEGETAPQAGVIEMLEKVVSEAVFDEERIPIEFPEPPKPVGKKKAKKK